MIDIDEMKTSWCLTTLKDISLSIQYGYTASAIEQSTGVKQGRKEIETRATGNQQSMRNIAQKAFSAIEIPYAPLKEQKEIVCRIESLFKLADNIEQQYQQAEVDLETLNQSILAKAFRGELVPQNPNDEPASVLLERIKTERDKAKPKKSKTKKRSSNKQSKQLNIPGI